MRAEKLHSYLANPQLLNELSLPELSALKEQFPYFQTAHLLYSIASKQSDVSLFQRSIKHTAIVAVDRNHLYELLYKNNRQKPVEVIQQDTAEVETVQPEIKSDSPQIQTALSTKVEEIVEIAEEQPLNTTVETTVRSVPETINDKTEPTEITADNDLEQLVEKEMQKDIVEAFVEREILKTHEANKKEEAVLPKDASFGQWLSFLKKNNGGPLSQVEMPERKGLDKDKEERKDQSQEVIPEKKDDELLEEQMVKHKKKMIIDKIIEMNPGAIKLNKDTKFYTPDLKAKESLQENEHLVTETLAKIYALQGNIGKAIRAYEILSLKYPNKSIYFASLIEDLKKGH